MALLLIIPILSLSFAFPNYSLRKLSYCSNYLLSRHLHGDKNPSLCSLRAGAGFGFGSAPKISKMNDQNSTIGDTTSVVAALKQQVLIIKDSDSCDYERYLASALDPVKAVKAWRKEIVTANSEKFEFLKLNIISDDPSTMSNFTQAALANSSLPAKAVKFQVLLRTRGTNGKLVPFEEESIFVKDSVESIAGSSSKGSSRSSRKKAGEDSAVAAAAAEQWLYSYGLVSPMKEEDVASLMKQVDNKYQTMATIRDKW